MIGTRVRPARMADLPAVAAVLQDAFSDKTRIIFGRNPEKVYTVLEAVYAGPVQHGYDGVLVAEQHGRVVGTLIMGPVYYTPQESRMFEHLITQELGVPRTLWAAFLLWLIGHKPEPDEAYISDVAVASGYQGRGLGALLLEHAEQWAWDHDCARLTLWVAATNARAVHVYEQAGFTVTRTTSSWLTRLIFGIRHWHFMEKPLVDLSPAQPSFDPNSLQR
ncbi:MAG: GNAT family N-acetyltransferase [Anaerolineae bacterium]|nr:GNAT family N-acetyltransferase [Anaerolineae bacterium]